MKKFLIHTSALLTLFIAAMFSMPASSQTLSLNDGITIQPKTNRVGINIGSITFYDNGQLLKNLIGSFNPGFEPLINRQVWNIEYAGTANSFAMNNIYDGAPANYWAGATFIVYAGVPGAPEDGCTGLVASNTGPNNPVNTSVAPVITFANSCGASLAPNDIITLTKTTFPTPESWWENPTGGLGGGGTTVKNGAKEYSDTTDLCATCGVQALTMDASTSGSEADLYYNYDGAYNVDVSVLMNGNYQLSFWAKAVSGKPKLIASAARLSSNGFNCGTQTFTPTTTWAQYTWTCTANENAASLVPNAVQIELSTTGGALYLDNVDWQKITSTNNPTVFRDEVIETLQNYFATSTPGPRGIFRDWTNQNGETVDNWIAPSYAHSPTGTGGGYYVGPTGTGAAGLQIEDYLVICETIGADPYFVFPVTASNQEGTNLIEFLAGSSSTTYGAKRAALGQVEPWTTVFGTIHISLGNEDWNNFSFDGQAIYDNHVQPNSQGDYDYTLRAGGMFSAMRSAPDYDHTKFDFVMNAKTATTSNPQSVARSQADSVELEDYTQSAVDSFANDSQTWGAAFVEPWLKVTSAQDPKNFYASATAYKALSTCGYDGKQQCGVNIYEWGQGTLGSSQAARSAGTGLDQATLDIVNAGSGEGIVTALQPLLNMQYFNIEAQSFFSLDQLQAATSGNAVSGSCSATATNCSYQTILAKLWGGTIDMGGFTNNIRPTMLGIQLVNQSIIGPMFSCPINNNLTYTFQASLNGNGDGTHDNGFRTPQMTNVPYLYSFCFENGKSRSIVLINTDISNSHTLSFSGNNVPTGTVVQRQYAPSSLDLLNESPVGTSNQNATMKTTLSTSSLSSPTSITLPAHSVTALDYTAASAPYASMPVFSPNAGTYTVPTAVTVSSTPGATIYYTMDGTTPTTSSNVYTGPVMVGSNKSIAAMAADNGFNNSGVASASYIIAPVLPTPMFGVATGTYTTPQAVAITDSVSSATIYYTTNGTAPTTSSTKYTGPVTVSANETLEAIAVQAGNTNSSIVASSYVISPVLPTPTFSSAAGTYASSQSISIADAMAGTIIYYAINHTPTTSSSVYTGPIMVSATETLEAIAVKAGFTNSAIASAAYTISGSVAYINYASGGFAASAFNLNNGAAIASTGLLQLTDGGAGENRSAWFSTKVPVQNFVTDFTFQQLNATADGMTFTIQGMGSTALGANGASLGYQGITKSVAIKFDLYSNAGEGSDSTGLYTNGAIPTLPSVDLSSTGINLHSGDMMDAHMVYDGTNLTMTLTDTVTNAAVTEVFPVNIPSIVGATTAQVGFTAGTGGHSSTQNILSWTYVSSGAQAQTAATPTFSVAAGTYTAAQSVTIADTTSGATIYYTTNGATPTASSTKYTGPVAVSTSQTLQAIAIETGYTNSAVASAAYTIAQVAAAPTFSVAAGNYTTAQTVTITDATSGATIYYTTNGATPTASSTKYAGAISVSASETLKAIAIETGYTNSAVASAAYTIAPVLATPTFSLTPGTFTTAQTVTIADASSGTTVYYTTNGTTPTASSTKYAGAISVSASETLKAIAIETGYANSAVASAAYTIAPVLATPAFSVAPGTYTTAQTVTIADATSGATIYYTTNGTTPTASSTKYAGPITVSANVVLEAIAIETGYTNSAVASAAYTIAPVLAPPTFSVAAGTYTASQSITLSEATSGVTIYYTTNGTTPTTASSVYNAPIAVSATETVEAMAAGVGYTPSSVATAVYTIAPNVSYVNNPNGGFAASSFKLNNGASITSGGALQLTDGGAGENRTAWSTTQVPVQSFTTDFTFKQTNPVADGMTFTIQGAGLSALGGNGAGLGYQGIGKSVAIKFDLYSNAGEGPDSTGLYTNGAAPTMPAVNLSSTGINLHSGDVMHAHLVYDGKNLTMTLTDTVTKGTVTEVFPVNIPSIVGGNTAYVGFTGGAGGHSSTQQVLTWTYIVP